MLQCMESLGNAYKMDYEYEFYKKYLQDFKDYDVETEFALVDDELKECFDALNVAYTSAKSVPVSERGMEDKLADSFMFYVSTGVIVVQEGKYYINLNKLYETTKQFVAVQDEKGISKTKGSLK